MNWLLVAATVVALLLLQGVRSFGHANAQQLFLRLFGRNLVALWLYALFMLPGTLLHEVAHVLAAFLLGVEVRGISLRPVLQEEEVVLGAVESERTDMLRDGLVGLAPLMAGTVVISLIGMTTFGLEEAYRLMTAGQWFDALKTLTASLGHWRGWVNLYFVFVISLNMFPSPTDRRAWLPVGLLILLLVGLAGMVGLLRVVLEEAAVLINTLFGWFLLVLGFTLLIDLIALFLLIALHEAVAKQFGPP